MKKLTYLLILMSAVSLIQADEADEKLSKYRRTCREITKHPWNMVCDSRGRQFESRCDYDCHKKFKNWKVAEEAECKEGSTSHCWNKCTDEEKKRVDEPTMCNKEPPHDPTKWPCQVKCFQNRYKKVEFVPCSEVKKE